MIPLAYCERDYCKKFIMGNRFKGISSGHWETVDDSQSAFMSEWKRVNCHPRHQGSIDLNIKTTPAERYTRGLQYLDSLLPFFILSPSRRRFVLRTEGFVPWTSSLLSPFLNRSYSRTLLVFCPARKKRPRVDLFSTDRRELGNGRK